MSTWTELYGVPLVTVSATGLGVGQPTNNGADFGPDTPGTSTSGIQEALNSIASTGGHVFCNRGSYAIRAALYYTGSFQLLEFASGSSLTYADGLTGVLPNWFDPGNHFHHTPSLIHMGSPVTSSSPTPHSHQYFRGNGLQLNWGANSSPTLNDGFQILIPGQNSSSAYTGPGGEDYEISGVVLTGQVSGQILFGSDQYNNALTLSQFSKVVRFTEIFATYGNDSNVSGLSAIYIRGGGCEIVVENCIVDCSGLPSSDDYDPINVAGNSGETFNVLVSRCYFKANGVSGQCVEVQGNPKAGATDGGCHEIVFEHCTFDSGATALPPLLAGSGGAYVDDSNGSASHGQVWNVDFRFCKWIFAGMSLQSETQTLTVGASPFSYTNNDGHPEGVTISGGTVSSIVVTPYGQGGITTGASSGTFLLRPGDKITVTYTAAPTMSLNAFGFLRFDGNAPGSFSGSLTLRGPASQGGSVAVGASPWTYQNMDGFPETVIVSGGTVTQISFNGNTTGRTSGDFYLQTGDTLAVTYTVKPAVIAIAK